MSAGYVPAGNTGRLLQTFRNPVGPAGEQVDAEAVTLVDANGLPLRSDDEDQTLVVRELTRSRGNPLTSPFTITGAGSPHVLTPSVPTNALRIFWVSAAAQPGSLLYPLITVTLPTVGNPTREIYRQYAIGHAEMFEGAAGEPATVATGGAGTVSGIIHYEEFTP